MSPSLAKALTPRDRRALLWGGVIAAAALAFALVVKPYVRALREARDDLSMQRELLARERAVLGVSHQFPAALLESRSTWAQSSTPLFGGADEVSATSDLSDHISEAALANRVLIQQLETRKGESLDQEMVALAVDFRAEGDFEGLLRFLNSLERGDKLVRVSTLVVQRQDRPVASGVPDTEVLSISGTMTGYGAFPSVPGRIADSTTSPASATSKAVSSRSTSISPDTL